MTDPGDPEVPLEVLKALDGGDLGPLVHYLLNARQPPRSVIVRLAKLLDPAREGDKGALRLVWKRGGGGRPSDGIKKDVQQAYWGLRVKARCTELIASGWGNGVVNEAIAQIAEESGYSASTLEKAWQAVQVRS